MRRPESSPGDTTAELVLIGIGQRGATPDLLERLFLEEPNCAALLGELREAGIDHAIVLPTCERLEILAAHPHPEAIAERLEARLAEWAGVPPAALVGLGYRLFGKAAVRHLFGVASALDSQVVGEPQVLGQVKQAYHVARAAGMTGSLLETVMQSAFAAAKRVRNETSVAEQPVSLASAALAAARELHGELAGLRALVLGLGEMGELLIQKLKEAGLSTLVVMHPVAQRAAAVAQRHGCHMRDWEELGEALADADMVVGALGSGRLILTPELFRAALRVRRHRPIFVMDAAIPGDVDPAVQELDDVFLYDLDDLERIVTAGQASRAGALSQAWAIVDEAVGGFVQQRAERGATPAIAELKAHFEAVRTGVLRQGEIDAEEATRLLVARLLNEAARSLREAAAGAPEERQRLEGALRRAFRLTDGAGPSEDEDEESQG
jgi:glutamyl-tRNA reductase